MPCNGLSSPSPTAKRLSLLLFTFLPSVVGCACVSAWLRPSALPYELGSQSIEFIRYGCIHTIDRRGELLKEIFKAALADLSL